MPWVGIASLSGLVAVALGAFGAHGLRARLGAEGLPIYQTAVLYHLTHTLALLALGLFAHARGLRFDGACWCFLLGIVFFSGSLYLLAVTGAKWLGAVTPVGGVFFLMGWALTALRAFRSF